MCHSIDSDAYKYCKINIKITNFIPANEYYSYILNDKENKF